MKQIVLYIITGILTTFVNYGIYYILLDTGWLFANTFAWITAVIFAFYTNRKIVFQSHNDPKKEALAFISLRFMTLLVESILLWILIEWLYINMMFSKILVSIMTVIANYGLCKWKIFKHQEGGILYEQN